MDQQVAVNCSHLDMVKFASFLSELEKIAAENPELADLILKEAMPNIFRPLGAAAKAVGSGVKGAVGAVGSGLNRANIAAHALHASSHGPEVFEGAEKVVHGLMGGHLTSGLIDASPHFYGAGKHALTAHVMPAARSAGSAIASGVKNIGRVIPRMPGPPALTAV